MEDKEVLYAFYYEETTWVRNSAKSLNQNKEKLIIEKWL